MRATGMRSHLVLAAALAAAAAAGALFARLPFSMSQGFEKALSTSRSELTFNPSATHNRAGDEGYWLTRAEMQSPGLFEKPVAIGDRITITGTDGVERKLEVVAVTAVGGTQPVAAAATRGLVLVTCRLKGDAAGETLVRFIVEGQTAGPAKPEKTASTPKAL
ncbi:MAG: hypothetical protein NW223_16045 [Hyphomicrobiaceae bacterium]|nr:hypothetical protein [Hyphomicrobiaceae bacterium]